MPSVIVDYSPLHRNANQTPPKSGSYSFLVGSQEFHTVGSLQDGLNQARRLARENGLFRVIMTSAR